MTDTPAVLLAEFEHLVLTDLLGPPDPNEVVSGIRSPLRDWYLVGMYAFHDCGHRSSRIDQQVTPMLDGGRSGAPTSLCRSKKLT